MLKHEKYRKKEILHRNPATMLSHLFLTLLLVVGSRGIAHLPNHTLMTTKCRVECISTENEVMVLDKDQLSRRTVKTTEVMLHLHFFEYKYSKGLSQTLEKLCGEWIQCSFNTHDVIGTLSIGDKPRELPGATSANEVAGFIVLMIPVSIFLIGYWFSISG